MLGWKTLGHQQKLDSVRHHQLRRRLCDLLPGHGQRGPDRHAAHDVADQADGERGQDACVCQVPAETFDFLGYTFGRCYAPRTGRAYLGTRPARAKVQKLCRSLSALTNRKSLRLDPKEIVGCLQQPSTRLGQLLLSGLSQQSLPCRGTPRRGSAPPVVVSQAQRRRVRERHASPTSTCSSRWDFGPDHPPALAAIPSESVNNSYSTYPCPRAGCGKTARPVR